jgi:hypothetical protein
MYQEEDQIANEEEIEAQVNLEVTKRKLWKLLHQEARELGPGPNGRLDL